MVLVSQEIFFSLISQFEIVPYTQSRGMFDYLALSGVDKIKFFVNDLYKPTIACFGNEKSFGIWKMITIEGESLFRAENLAVNDIRTFYNDITLLGYDFVEVCSNSEYDFGYETALRQAGYLRPVGQFSMPLTKVIDLTSEIKYNQNWKRNLKKSIQNELTFESIDNPKITDCNDFISIYQEMISRKSLSVLFSTEQIFLLCKNGDFRLFFASKNQQRVASIIVHQRKTHAGLLYAATNKLALQNSASFFMYDELFKYLRDIGIQSFDMEKLVPSTKSVNSVFLFKNGVEGKHIQLNGEWSWCKKKYYRPLMYFVKKYLMKKWEL
jgi:hypothetical protein